MERRRAVPGTVRQARRELLQARQKASPNKVFTNLRSEATRNASPLVLDLYDLVSARLGYRPQHIDELNGAERDVAHLLSDEDHADLVVAIYGETLSWTQRAALGRLPAWRHLLPPGAPKVIGEDKRGRAATRVAARPVRRQISQRWETPRPAPAPRQTVPVKLNKAQRASALLRRQAAVVVQSRRKPSAAGL